jgi:hypothetical protein
MQENLVNLIQDAEKKGQIVFWTAPNKLGKINLDQFVRQSTSGILYDLNRTKEVALSFIQNGDEKWVNNYATALVIEKLKELLKNKEI